MTESDPLRTQRDVSEGTDPDLAADLHAAGFQDAVEIGRGGFGVVYRCHQTALDRTVAVKILTADLDEENLARFFREQKAVGRLTGHPNIVHVLHIGATTTGRPYLVMQYYPRGSLDEWIRRHGPLSTEQVLRLGVKIAGAIESAHHFGIVHRDVKPANILITDYGEPVLADFGIAHISGGFQTAAGAVTGSPAFTAPEILAGNRPSPASDMYGLGATLFCALTGHAAFERLKGEQVIAQFLRISTQPVPNLRESGIDNDVSTLIEAAMSRSIEDRPSATALGKTVRQLQNKLGFPVDEMALHAGPHNDRYGPLSVPGHSPSTPSPRENHQPTIRSSLHPGSGNLPFDLTSFVGRRAELDEAKELLSRFRLLTLTGMGGVGKTRLGLRVAADLQDSVPDGVWLVELGELHDGSLLVELVARTLGVHEQPGRPLRTVLVDFVSSRNLLLVLDNCEHVLAAVAELAETLLRRSPTLRILATSREALTIGGEALLQVTPLPVPNPDQSLVEPSHYDSVALFTERAAAVHPEFRLTTKNEAVVGEICSRLDGLPLAIELAAARVRVMSPPQILERLTNRFALLTRGTRGAPERQQTLRWSIEWSYQLCTPTERHLWSTLSVFADGFELDAVEGICSTNLNSTELLDLLSSLVDKSILLREETRSIARFRLLETVREYGRTKLEEAGSYVELRRRHRNWYKQLAFDAEAGWISDRQLEWIDRLEREQANLREALRFTMDEAAQDAHDMALHITTALFAFWLSRGLLSEGRYWLDRALASNSTQRSPARVSALCAESVLAELQGDLTTGWLLIEQGRALTGPDSEPIVIAEIAHAEGISALFGGNFNTARIHLEDALETFDANRALRPQVETLLQLGWAHALCGDTERALSCYEEALTLTESRGESVYRSYALWGAAVVRWQQDDAETAVPLLQQCLRLARLRNDPMVAAPAMEALAWTACAHDSMRASVLMGAAETLGRKIGSSPVLFPGLLPHHDTCEQRARRTLGPRAFETARNKGTALGFEASVAYALNEISVDASLDSSLTRRERRVAELAASGRTDDEIAEILAINRRTVHKHLQHILTKLGLTSRAQIASGTPFKADWFPPSS